MAEQIKQRRVIERNEPRESIVAWFVIVALVFIMLIETGLLIALVGDRERDYQYLSRPFVPASAYAATEPSPSTTTTSPNQVQLPPAVVGKRSK